MRIGLFLNFFFTTTAFSSSLTKFFWVKEDKNFFQLRQRMQKTIYCEGKKNFNFAPWLSALIKWAQLGTTFQPFPLNCLVCVPYQKAPKLSTTTAYSYVDSLSLHFFFRLTPGLLPGALCTFPLGSTNEKVEVFLPYFKLRCSFQLFGPISERLIYCSSRHEFKNPG